MFNRLEMIVNPVLVYERGDALAKSVARLHSIVEDPFAGRAARDPVDPALDPVIADLSRPSRILLTELANRGYISLELIGLADATLDQIKNSNYRRMIRGRWSSGSPLARAARAAGLYFEEAGVDLDRVHLLGSDVRDQVTPWAIEAREGKLDLVVSLMGRWQVREWLFVIRPMRRKPLIAVLARALDGAALEAIGDVHAWLAEHAPHVGRIG